MQEKTPLVSSHPPAAGAPSADDTMASPRSRTKSRLHMAMAVLFVSLFWLATTWTCDADHDHDHAHAHRVAKVPMDVHIMSKCPDARECLNKLVVPTMANVSDKVDFRLSMIGTYVLQLPRQNTWPMLTTTQPDRRRRRPVQARPD